jgi:hypothetical protein
MYESLMTTAFVTIVAGFDTNTLEYAFGGIGLVAFVNAPIVRITTKIAKMKPRTRSRGSRRAHCPGGGGLSAR